MTTDPASAAPPPEQQPHQQYPAAQPVGYTQPSPEAPQYPQAQPYPAQPYAAQQYPGQSYPPHGYPAAPQYPPQLYPQPQRGKTSFGIVLAAALPWPVGILVLMFAALGAPDDPRNAGRLMGFMLFPWLGAALFTWLIFRRRRTNFFVLLAVTLPFFFMLFGFAAAGQLHR